MLRKRLAHRSWWLIPGSLVLLCSLGSWEQTAQAMYWVVKVEKIDYCIQYSNAVKDSQKCPLSKLGLSVKGYLCNRVRVCNSQAGTWVPISQIRSEFSSNLNFHFDMNSPLFLFFFKLKAIVKLRKTVYLSIVGRAPFSWFLWWFQLICFNKFVVDPINAYNFIESIVIIIS